MQMRLSKGGRRKLKKRKYTKFAFMISICLLILWGVLGAQSTIAWFKDETPVAKNTFDIQQMDLAVYHKVGDSWEEVDEDTELFDREAIYEPGYTQVVYLKIENRGEVDFDYRLSVDMISYVPGESVLGNPIYLPNYLKFGAIVRDNEPQLTRDLARTMATEDIKMLPLNTYSSEKGELDADKDKDSENFAAIVIYMPEHIGNEANYRGNVVPEIQLGITVKASQRGTLED